MSTLQVKNVPADLHQKIQRWAKREGKSVRDVVLDAVRREIQYAEFAQALAKHPPVELGCRAAELIEEERFERDEDEE